MASTTSDAPQQRALKQSLLIIFLARTALNTAHRIVYPFLPSIARGLGISLQAASGLVTLRMLAGLTAPVIGPAGDRYGRRRTMEAGLLIFSVAGLLLAGPGTFAAVAVAFALYGLAKVLYDPAVHAYVGDTVPYEKRGRAVGIVELSWSCAWLLGVPISGFLIERVGWRAPWAVLAVLGFAGMWLTHTRLPPTSPPSHEAEGEATGSSRVPATRQTSVPLITTWRSLLRRRPVVILLLTSLLLTMANEVPFIVYGAWLETTFSLSLSALGLASIVVGLAEASAELGTTVFTDRLGKRRSVLLGLLGLAASLLLLPWLSQYGLAAALTGVALMLVTFEFGIVSLLPLATELAPDARATLLSLNIMAMSLGRILGAGIGAWLWQWQRIALHAVVGAACALLAALLLAWGMAEIGS
jgi:predicted MFS family arabinose efflux permease